MTVCVCVCVRISASSNKMQISRSRERSWHECATQLHVERSRAWMGTLPLAQNCSSILQAGTGEEAEILTQNNCLYPSCADDTAVAIHGSCTKGHINETKVNESKRAKKEQIHPHSSLFYVHAFEHMAANYSMLECITFSKAFASLSPAFRREDLIKASDTSFVLECSELFFTLLQSPLISWQAS